MNKLKLPISESIVSMLLGAVVVLLIGLLAYNYFRTNKPAAPVMPRELEQTEETRTPSGELASPSAAVALPATHNVMPGETLWSIAEKYYQSGYNYQDIVKANQLSNPGNIEVGQKLTVPNVTVKAPLTSGATVMPSVTLSKIDGGTYTVIRGDNLWAIAVRAYGDGYRWTELAKVNKLVYPNIIHAGNVLTIPRP